MNTNAYENVLRGGSNLQPMRNDSLRGITDTYYWGPALAIAAGLIGYSYYTSEGLDNTLLMTGGAFLTGWLVGGGAAHA